MRETTEEFIANFHSLSGTTLGEKRKNLFLLLKAHQSSLKLEAGEDIEVPLIIPKTPLEEVFRVEVLIYFRNVPELIDVVKGGNPILTEKILKCSSWFFESLLDNIDEKHLVEQLFPCISFNTKVKILNKLAICLKDTRRADLIFEAVKNKYGLYLATKLLSCCSEALIMQYTKSLKIEITGKQLLVIVTRYPQSTEPILEALSQFHNKNTINCKYRRVFVHLLKNDRILFMKLSKQYGPSFNLGWRATNKFIVSKKQDFIENAQQFHKFLHKKQTRKSIHQDFPEFYSNMLPPSISQFRRNLDFYIELMNNLPKNVSKFNLLLTTFQKNYGSQFWDHPICITPTVLELMSVQERETWMQGHPKPCDMSEVQWICLKKTDISVPALKKKISLTSSIKERSQLVGSLVETCRINEDREALNAVCKYVISQHRNDSSSILLCFLKTLKDCYRLDTLDKEQWKCINDIVQLFIARNEIPYYYFEWIYEYISYHMVNGLLRRAQLVDLVKKTNSGHWYGHLKRPQDQKKALQVFYEIIPELHKEEQNINNAYVDFLNVVVQWNREHPHCPLSLLSYTDAVNALETVLKKDDNFNYTAEIVLAYCLRLRINESEKARWLNLLWNRKTVNVEMDYLEWLIKYEPLTVAKHTVTLVNPLLDLWYTLIRPAFWRHCRYYAHLEIPQKIITMCLDTINSKEKNDMRKKNAITALSCLMDSTEFIKFIVPYYPVDLQMDVNSEETQETYKLQQAITANLRNVVPSLVTIKSVLIFSKGDYLKFIQRSLHSVSLSAAEERLVPFFEALADRPVSVRKHAIYHTFKVLNKTEIYKMLNKSMETEKNSTIRKVLFKATFKFFTKNPDDHLWNLVQQNARCVDISDTEAFDVLMDASNVPLGYLPNYIVFTWTILESLPKMDNKMEKGKYNLFDAVSATVLSLLSEEFCWGIIEKYIFKFKELTSSQIKIFNFICKYILYSTSELEQEKRLNKIFTLIKDYINSTWYNSDSKVIGRKFIYKFLEEFCWFFLNKKSYSPSILTKFNILWSNFLQPHEAIDEYLLLQFSLIFVDYALQNLTWAQIGEKLAKFCDTFSSSYGSSVVDMFCDSLNDFIHRFLNIAAEESELNRLTIIESIIKTSSSQNCLLMAILLLPENIPTSTEVKLMINGIINMLQPFDNLQVRLKLSCYLHNISTHHQFAASDESDFIQSNIKLQSNTKQKRLFISIEEFSSGYKNQELIY